MARSYIQVRTSPEFLAALQQVAEELDTTMSELQRQALLKCHPRIGQLMRKQRAKAA